VDNRNVLALHVVHDDFADVGLGHEVAVPEEEQVAALEGGFHAAGEDDDDRGGRVCEDRKAFPHLPRGVSKQDRKRTGAGNGVSGDKRSNAP
jgi:hypothetical protein